MTTYIEQLKNIHKITNGLQNQHHNRRYTKQNYGLKYIETHEYKFSMSNIFSMSNRYGIIIIHKPISSNKQVVLKNFRTDIDLKRFDGYIELKIGGSDIDRVYLYKDVPVYDNLCKIFGLQNGQISISCLHDNFIPHIAYHEIKLIFKLDTFWPYFDFYKVMVDIYEMNRTN